MPLFQMWMGLQVGIWKFCREVSVARKIEEETVIMLNWVLTHGVTMSEFTPIVTNQHHLAKFPAPISGYNSCLALDSVTLNSSITSSNDRPFLIFHKSLTGVPKPQFNDLPLKEQGKPSSPKTHGRSTSDYREAGESHLAKYPGLPGSRGPCSRSPEGYSGYDDDVEGSGIEESTEPADLELV